MCPDFEELRPYVCHPGKPRPAEGRWILTEGAHREPPRSRQDKGPQDSRVGDPRRVCQPQDHGSGRKPLAEPGCPYFCSGIRAKGEEAHNRGPRSAELGSARARHGVSGCTAFEERWRGVRPKTCPHIYPSVNDPTDNGSVLVPMPKAISPRGRDSC